MNAITIRPSTGEPQIAARSLVIAKSVKVPREIQDGILALPVAFQAGRSLDQGERDLQALLYVEALEGVQAFIADLVLRRIRLFNPRNPFPPTAQDIREHCEATCGALWSAVWSSAVCGEKWRLYSTKLPAGWFGNPGPEPFEPGCLVPDEIASKWIRDRIAGQAEIDELRRFSETPVENSRWLTTPEFLRRTSLSAVRKLPDNALPPGFRELHEAAARALQECIERQRREQGENCD